MLRRSGSFTSIKNSKLFCGANGCCRIDGVVVGVVVVQLMVMVVGGWVLWNVWCGGLVCKWFLW